MTFIFRTLLLAAYLGILSGCTFMGSHIERAELGVGRTIPQNGSTGIAGHLDFVTDKNFVMGIGNIGAHRIYQRWKGVNYDGAYIPNTVYLHASKRLQWKWFYGQLGGAWVNETSNTVSTPFQFYSGAGIQWDWTENWGGSFDFRHLSNGGGFFGIIESGPTENEGVEYWSFNVRKAF